MEEEKTKALKKEIYSRLPKTDIRPVEWEMYLSCLVSHYVELEHANGVEEE